MPKGPQKLLVAFDGSAGGGQALEFTLEMLFQKSRGDELTVLSVNKLPDDFQDIMAALSGEQAVEIVEDSLEYKDRLAKTQEEFSDAIIADANIIVEEHGLVPKEGDGTNGWKLVHEPITVHHEDPRDVITEFVPDVLIVGSRGMGAIKRAFIGSVSDHLVHHVTCPVVVVK